VDNDPRCLEGGDKILGSAHVLLAQWPRRSSKLSVVFIDLFWAMCWRAEHRSCGGGWRFMRESWTVSQRKMMKSSFATHSTPHTQQERNRHTPFVPPTSRSIDTNAPT